MALVDAFLAEWIEVKIAQIEDTNKKDRILFLKARNNDTKYFNDIRTPFLKKIAEEEINSKK